MSQTDSVDKIAFGLRTLLTTIKSPVLRHVISGLAWRWSSVRDAMPHDRKWPDPTPAMQADPRFEAIWDVIKSWDISVPDAYPGSCGATGNHVRAILDGLDRDRLLKCTNCGRVIARAVFEAFRFPTTYTCCSAMNLQGMRIP